MEREGANRASAFRIGAFMTPRRCFDLQRQFAVDHHIPNARNVGRHDRNASRHRFDQHQAKSLRLRRQNKNIRLLQRLVGRIDPAVKWDPTGLGVVPSDFEPDDPTDVSEKMGGLHSAEVQENGRFVPLPEKEITGSRRIRFLFGIPEGVRAVKFAQFVTYFGHVDLPTPIRKPARA